MKALLNRCLANGLPDMALSNCHTPGVDSIVLEVNEAPQPKMVRMFVAWPGAHGLHQLRRPDDSFVLAVHNHRYDLLMRPVVGTIVNYELETAPWPIANNVGEKLEGVSSDRAIFCFPFCSGADKHGMALGRPRMDVILSENFRVLHPGEKHFMHAEELHTVIVPKSSDPVAWVIYEWADRIDSLLYSPTIHPDMSSDGLYEKMGQKEARFIVKSIVDLI